MPNQFICNICPLGATVYPTLFAMQEHIKQVHISQRRSGLVPSKVKEIEEAKAKEAPKSDLNKPQAPIASLPEKPQRKPIILEYMYSGECPTDGIPIETHALKVDAGLYMVAWCSNCKKQLKDLKVIPIEEMDKRIKENIEEEIAIDENKGVWPINKFRRK